MEKAGWKKNFQFGIFEVEKVKNHTFLRMGGYAVRLLEDNHLRGGGRLQTRGRTKCAPRSSPPLPMTNSFYTALQPLKTRNKQQTEGRNHQ